MTRLLLGSYTDSVYDVEFTAPSGNKAPSMDKMRDLPIGWGASWLAQHPTLRDIWYVCIEADDDAGTKMGVEGFVQVYRINDAGVQKLGEVSAVHNPCHVEVVGNARGLAVANYTGGTAMLIPLDADGLFIKPETPTFLKYEQLGPRPPRCHQCVDVPVKNEVWVVDCGNWVIWRMSLKGEGSKLAWTIAGEEDVGAGYAARQIVVSKDARHLYALHAGSCLVSHFDLSKTGSDRLVSIQDMLPAPHKIDMNNRVGPPFMNAAALTLHEPSMTLTATSRMLAGEKVDAVAFFKVRRDGTLSAPVVKRTTIGREFRGVGFVDDCFLVAGQDDGWMSCFQWDKETDTWDEKLFEPPVHLTKVVDIQVVK